MNTRRNYDNLVQTKEKKITPLLASYTGLISAFYVNRLANKMH